ncbi:MAG: oligosaccharide flippase family protein [Chloroflexi bacterium]|nr:oligosaccharide flippase family protein [Chloroflexota bacterium]
MSTLGSAVAVARRYADVVSSILTGFWGQATLVLSGPLAARILGPEDRGHFALLLILPLILCQVGTLGLPLASTYFIAVEPANTRAIARKLLPIALAQTTAIVAVNAVVVVLLFGRQERYLAYAGILSLTFIPVWIGLQYGLAFLQGRHLFGWFNIARVLPATLYGVVLIPLFFADGERLVAVTAAWVGAHFVAAVLALFFGLRESVAEAKNEPSQREMLHFGTRSMLGSISPVETFRVDQAVVGLFLSPAALGIYVVALAFTNLPRFVSQGVGLVAYPRIAAARGAGEGVRRLARGFILGTVALTLPIVIVLTLGAGIIIRVFYGDAFAEAATPARILLAGSFFFAARRILADCARGAGYGTLDTVAEISSWVWLLVALAILGPRFELNGVATSLTTAAAFSLLVLVVLLWAPFGYRLRAGVPRAARERMALAEVPDETLSKPTIP